MSAAEEVDVEVEKEEKEAGTEDSTKGEPLEENAKGALIVPGVRARLSNIADDGTWIKTEKYEYAGYTQTRTAGKSAGQALRSHLELQRALCRELEVFSEPAACVDPVLMNWMLQDQVPVYPCMIEHADQMGLQQNPLLVHLLLLLLLLFLLLQFSVSSYFFCSSSSSSSSSSVPPSSPT